MKKLLSLGLVALLPLISAAQTQNSKILYVSFNVFPATGSDPIEFYTGQSDDFSAIVHQTAFTLHSPFAHKEAALEQMAVNARQVSGSNAAVQKLRGLFRVEADDAQNDNLLRLAAELEALQIVNYCSLMDARPIAPPFDIPPATDDFQPLQSYIGANPGVNMQYAWDQGITGQGINVRDIEYGINVDHEELNEQNAFIAPGMTVNPGATEDYTEHGTAAIGVLYASPGTYGSTGLVHGAAEVILFPEYTVESGYDRVNAVFEAISSSNPGDVIMYEMQAFGALGSGSDYVPAEYDAPVWDLTKAATDGGIVIVAAAGNGNQNLDASIYTDYMNRGHSGAIIVGAGSPNTSHNRLSFSSYGSRVDVQGWGSNVFSPGYGDAFMVGGDFNQQYTYFSGTSSATPIVTSCAVALQSYYHGETGGYLSGTQIRDILFNTGISQGTGTSGNIGPLPNMEAALNYLIASVGVEELVHEQPVIAYPNPAEETVRFHFSGMEKAKVQLYDAQGRMVKGATLSSDEALDVRGLDRGVYLVSIEHTGGASTQRIVLR